MRLTTFEVDTIRSCARRFFGANASVRLFGSRVDDAATGGDVDLHIEAESADLAGLTNELEFRAQLREVMGDQQVDIVLRPPGYSLKPIDRIALETGVPLL